MEKELEQLIRKWVLANAVRYEGRANPGAIIGKLLAEQPDLKDQLKTIAKEVKGIVDSINAMSLEDQKKELEGIDPSLLEVKYEKQEHVLKELKDAEQGKIVMRLAPAPSGPLHIGHAFVMSLNSEYCRKYDGKLILRLEDTNPDNIDKDAYKMIEDDAQWLTNNNVKQVIVQSDRLHTYYDYAEKLVAMGKAYICTCNPDIFRELLQKRKACPCRNLDAQEQHLRYDKMFSGFEPGQAVMRIKTNLDDPNPAMRDWPAMRINHHVHPRTGTKEKVWPLMNFSVAIDDHELHVTHTVRGKDQKDNEKRQKIIFDTFGWKPPVHLYVGMINFEDIDVSKTETRLAIERGEYKGWDDIRLPYLAALKRRGYQPEIFAQWAIDMGINENDKKVSREEFFKNINAHNRKLIEPAANRYFFVADPVEVNIDRAPKQSTELKLHPNHKDRGMRKFETHEKFLLAKTDVERIKDEDVYRLMDCGNFTRKGDKFTFHSRGIEEYREKGSGIMHWLPVSEDLVPVEVLMDDNTRIGGFGEAGLKSLREGTIIQFERFGFVKLDKKVGNKLIFWFTHK